MLHLPHLKYKLVKGLSKILKILEKIAVSVFSPPDNKLIFDNFFPGGRANISRPV